MLQPLLLFHLVSQSGQTTLLTLLIVFGCQFIIEWKEKYAASAWCENVRTREKKKLWRRKDRKSTDAFQYPWKEITQEK